MKINTRRILVGGAILFVLIGGFAYMRSSPAPEDLHQELRLIDAHLTIEGVLAPRAVTVAAGTTALEMLRAESEKTGFALIEKEYAGLGSLVEEIGDLKNGTDGRYWTYSVNGIFASVGADNYELKPGDAIEWAFAVPASE